MILYIKGTSSNISKQVYQEHSSLIISSKRIKGGNGVWSVRRPRAKKPVIYTGEDAQQFIRNKD